MKKIESVTILMSTFNGEKFLEEQLSSIYRQENVHIKLLVRDDGSTDQTTDILKKHQSDGKLTYYSGSNLGPAGSFWNLLVHSPQNDYYAFSDQDDVWLKDKISAATDRISKSGNKPALYFSQTKLVDCKLNDLSSVLLRPNLNYGEALVHQFIGGCTIVLNDSLRRILLEYTPKYMLMHDVWVYDVAQAVGADIYFDEVPHILYRQHDSNTIGLLKDAKFVWKSRLRRFIANEHTRHKIATELWNGYSVKMSPANRLLTKLVVNYRKNFRDRVRLLLSREITCGNRKIELYARIAILLGKF